MPKSRYFILTLMVTILTAGTGHAREASRPDEPQKILTLDEFIQLATQSDTEFEEVLIDELTLHYQKALRLPAKDLVLSVKHQYEFFLDQDRESPDTTASLSKLFPYTGTQIEVEYDAGESISSATTSSSISYLISQPIAQNAFGRSTRLLDKIVGLEVDVARHQVIEAYEDYMATILTAYYTWYEDYENLKVGESSYAANMQLLDNINERQKQRIALPIDVNKVKLQVMSKEERLIELKEQYKNSLNTIDRMVRHDGSIALVPAEPRAMAAALDPDFEASFAEFQKASRTFDVLNKLEEKSTLQVARDADALLPSLSLLAGFEMSGEKYGIVEENNMFYGGVQFDWPLGDQVDRAEYEVSKIVDRRTQLSTVNTYYRLYTQLLNLYLQLDREKELTKIAEERITLAQSVLKDEVENYSFGKVTLNDYIQAVNALDTNRFNKITHESLYKKFLVEWLRLMDRLVQYKDVQPQLDDLKAGK